MREEKREGEAEDSGINDDDHVTSMGNYERVAAAMTLKNVKLGYKEDDKIDFRCLRAVEMKTCELPLRIARNI